MDVFGIGKELVLGLWNMASTLFVVIVPLMIFIELARGLGVLDALNKLFKPTLRYFHLPPQAGVPILVGQVLGLSYSAGVLMESAREKEMGTRDMWVICLFLSLCHALIEDTVVLMAVGANPVVLIGVRLGVALGVTFLAGRLYKGGEGAWVEA